MKFKCRICGSTEYEAMSPRVTGITQIGNKSVPALYYKCNGCSILFKNSSQFSEV